MILNFISGWFIILNYTFVVNTLNNTVGAMISMIP